MRILRGIFSNETVNIFLDILYTDFSVDPTASTWFLLDMNWSTKLCRPEEVSPMSLPEADFILHALYYLWFMILKLFSNVIIF